MRVEHNRRLARLEEVLGGVDKIDPFRGGDEARLSLLVEYCGLSPETVNDPAALGRALEEWLFSDFLPRSWGMDED